MDHNHQTMFSPLNVCLISEDFITAGDHCIDDFAHTYDGVKENHQDDEDTLLERRKLQCYASFIKNMERPYSLGEEEKRFEQISHKLPRPPKLAEQKNSDYNGTCEKKCLSEACIVTRCIYPMKTNDQYLTKFNTKIRVTYSLLAVSHGSPGQLDVPSIDAVVASRCWSLPSRYKAFVCTQSPELELIGSLYKVLPNGEDDRIMRNEASESQFNQVLNVKLEQIIKKLECPYSLIEEDNHSRILPLISRNGVSESQFNQVLNAELEQFIKNMECPYSVCEEDNQSRRLPSIAMIEMMFEQIKQKLPGPPEFLLCALAERKNSRVYGIVTQCICLAKKKDQYLTVTLQINMKVVGSGCWPLSHRASVSHRMLALKPSQIIIFRDGVSKSRFKQVLDVELEQIIKAITHLGKIKLQFMLIVAQKAGGCTENVTPGRVVDTGVHPRSDDFYLCVRSGANGTSFHAHSYVLLYGVGFSPHDLQKPLHSLSSMYVAASIVVPRQLVLPKREPKSVVAVAVDGDKRGYKRPRCGWDPFFRCADCRRIIIAKNLSVVFNEEMYGLLHVRTARVVAENVHGNLQLIGFDLACRHCRGIVGLGFVSLTVPRWAVYFLFRARVV